MHWVSKERNFLFFYIEIISGVLDLKLSRPALGNEDGDLTFRARGVGGSVNCFACRFLESGWIVPKMYIQLVQMYSEVQIFFFFRQRKIFLRRVEKMRNAHFGKAVGYHLDPSQTGLHYEPPKHQFLMPVNTAQCTLQVLEIIFAALQTL